MLERRNLPDMRMLQTFEAAARHGNFTRAADELALTQSAVSRQVRELEAQIGIELFDRVPGKVVVTREGERFLKEIERLLSMAETTMRHARATAPGTQLLAINALPTFAVRWLLPRLPKYVSDHPGTTFDLTTRRDIFDFSKVQCDLAIHYGQPNWPGATCTYLCSEIVLPVAGGALSKGRLDKPEDLQDAPKVHVSERPTLWSDWFTAMGLDIPSPRNGHWFDQFSLTIEAAKAGLGYALLPRYLIEAELASGALKVVLDSPHSTEQAYYIVTPEGRGAIADAFRAWLLSQVSFRPLAS
ncbi:DNA-binding transcriptional regulator, LysR family [Fulvimarina manganoxydans]|uniref:DNA-binding transcriptional regulator, LysR family n=1 Tax=Fulvimarina manganoxydans TaxID=937218 RepID=A0A1W2ENV5_9HYPH|nr:LysR family transcriptional regulator [Fulvimarina manganoxydans]MCK5933796.1 LysR family transcriptional regulator [Fulvimarina manganoxydans]MEE2951862.1 LysR family transcriptional regulator [Pseudomonadota bacterium]SMD10818.1 DNA-binding transcriptional regulator, LysR family [Fulvimarina manganoxydans]